MKTLSGILFPLLLSFSSYAGDCTLFIKGVSSNSELPSAVIIKEVKKQMKKKGYKLTSKKGEARFHLSGFFLGARYHDGNPTIFHAARYTATLKNQERGTEEVTSSVTFATLDNADLIVLKGALRKLDSCRD